MVTALLASIMAAMTFAQAFTGTWVCHFQTHATKWQIAAAPGSSWTTVRWGDQQSANGGIAYVGYITPKKQWIYEDFHYDGSYAVNTSSGSDAGTWRWLGTYFTGERTMHGAVTWKRSSPARIDRAFYAAGSDAAPTGRDYCTKS